MFGTLRAGSLLYILNKGENPSLTVGQVVSVTPPRPKVNAQFMPNPMQMEQVVDISVKVGDDKQAITNEVEAFGTISQNALNSVPYHKKVVAACKQMMLDLNPSLQKEAERDSEMSKLKGELAEMKNSVGELTSLLKSVLNSNKKGDKQWDT